VEPDLMGRAYQRNRREVPGSRIGGVFPGTWIWVENARGTTGPDWWITLAASVIRVGFNPVLYHPIQDIPQGNIPTAGVEVTFGGNWFPITSATCISEEVVFQGIIRGSGPHVLHLPFGWPACRSKRGLVSPAYTVEVHP